MQVFTQLTVVQTPDDETKAAMSGVQKSIDSKASALLRI